MNTDKIKSKLAELASLDEEGRIKAIGEISEMVTQDAETHSDLENRHTTLLKDYGEAITKGIVKTHTDAPNPVTTDWNQLVAQVANQGKA